MFDLKKKLNAIMPGESARGALQNVLTVDWSGHKTVLVEVPGTGAQRSNEVEMDGMGGAGDYGRLIDDDEDEQAFHRNRGYFEQPRHHGQYTNDTPPPLPPKPTSTSTSYRGSSYTQQSSHPGQYTSADYHRSNVPDSRMKSKNPFKIAEEPSDDFDFNPRPLAKPAHLSLDGKKREKDLLSFDEETPRGWSTFSDPAMGRVVADSWAGRGWGTGNGQGQTSPTSSTGTRMSTAPSIEDPFRN